MKDIYRVETDNDVYPDCSAIDCYSNCGSYTNEYVHWLEARSKKLREHVREIRDLAMQDKSSEIIKLIESKTLKLLK